MRKIIMMALPIMLCAAVSQAQNISGNVKDDQGKALSGATITLKKAKDSAVVKLNSTNSSGQYSFAGINPGNYFVAATFTGRAQINSPAFEFSGTGDVAVPDVVLPKATGNLKEVVVAVRKPMVEVKADKTILNVEGSINSVGQDALELLRKAPGVLVDKDDNLSVLGKNGVQVYVDGRPTPLSGADLAQYLKSIQSSSVEAIEIITNPSAKYEAAGNAGIINIKLKKNKSFGTNGSLTAGYNLGITPKYNGGISLNHRDKGVNIFGNYNYSRNNQENTINLYREVADSIFDGHSGLNFKANSHNFKAGADFTVNKRTTLGVMVNGTLSDQEITNLAKTNIYYKPTHTLAKSLVADNSTNSKRNNVNNNVNFRYADSSGRELNMDADYGLYRIKSDQIQPNYYYDPSGNPTNANIYNMLAPSNIDIYSFKTDYEQNYKKGRLGVGGKVSYVKSGNDFSKYDVIGNSKLLDQGRSNNFDYEENINALYVNYNRQLKKGIMFQAGVRMENTNAKGHSTGKKWNGSSYDNYDSTFNRHYTDFFPSAALTFNKKPTNQWSFTYSRRIDRPSYQSLNPFEFRLDDYTYQKGNTNLTPQYTNSFGVTNTYKYRLNTTLNYSHVKDVFSQIVEVTETSKAFITQKNLATQDIVSLNISYPYQYKWYSIFFNVNGSYSHYKADFGPDKKVNLDAFAANIYAQQTFKLNKTVTGEISGFFNSPTIWQGTFKSKSIWGIDAGFLKTLMKGKGSLKLSVSDIFNSIKWKGESNYAGQMLIASGKPETRMFKAAFTYRFGNNQVKAARQRKTASEDEGKRVGSQGGGIGQ